MKSSLGLLDAYFLAPVAFCCSGFCWRPEFGRGSISFFFLFFFTVSCYPGLCVILVRDRRVWTCGWMASGLIVYLMCLLLQSHAGRLNDI